MNKIQRVAGAIALALGGAAATPALANCTAHEGAPAIVDTSMLEVKATSVDVSSDGGHRWVTTLGTIANPSRHCFQNVVLELQYFDAAKNHVDTLTEPMEGLLVPAGDTVQFRVREPASRDAAAYVSQSVRVIDADMRWTKAPPPASTFVDVLVGWAPMLLLIAIWLFVMRRYLGRKSVQARTLALMEQQLDVARAQGLAIQKVAAALERRAGGDPAA